jgi:hypothetical protein
MKRPDKLGLARKLRRVPTEKIILTELAEAQRRLEAYLARTGLTEAASGCLAGTHRRLQAIAQQWTLRQSQPLEQTHEMLATLRNEVRIVTRTLRRLGVRDPQAA